TALAVARHVKCGFDVRAKGVQEAPRRLVFYKSGEGHGCHQKAIELLGIGHENLRVIPHNAGQQMVPAALDAAIHEDVAHGRTPGSCWCATRMRCAPRSVSFRRIYEPSKAWAACRGSASTACSRRAAFAR